MYNLPEEYRADMYPVDFDDDPQDREWQPEVYDYAFNLAEESGASRVIDLGCGQARKLQNRGNIEIIGVDRPPVINKCLELYPDSKIKWYKTDFLHEERLGLEFEDAVVISCDVIEHLTDPIQLLDYLMYALEQGAKCVILSTPDRVVWHGEHHMGPPPNVAHVREWQIDELVQFVSEYGFNVMESRLTKSNTVEEICATSLLVLQ